MQDPDIPPAGAELPAGDGWRPLGWRWVLAMLVPILALAVAAPWVREPFAVWDFGELLPVLRGSDGALGAVSALAEYYGADGRANYLTYAQIAATWLVAGDSELGWQFQRAFFMLAVGGLFVLVGWRMGAAPLAASLGGLLATLAASAMEGWALLVGEPLGVVLLLAMALVSAGYRDRVHWKASAILLGVLALGVMQAKEILGVCIPVLVVLAACSDPLGRLRAPRWDVRTRWLVGSMAVALAIELSIFLPVLGDLAAEGYAGGYGQGPVGGGRLIGLALAMTLPTWFSSSLAGSLLYPANAAAALLLIFGAAAWLRSRSPGAPAVLLLALLPLVGAATYAPWPRYAPFYGMPFWVASAGLIVACATVLLKLGRVAGIVAVGLMWVAVGFTAMVADRSLKERHAHAAVAEAIVREMPGWPAVDTVLMAVPNRGPRRWPVTGPELARYAVALDPSAPSPPPMIDVPCEEVVTRLRGGLQRVALLSDPQPCGPLPIRTGVHVRRYRYLDWVTLSWFPDSVVVESLVTGLLGRR